MGILQHPPTINHIPRLNQQTLQNAMIQKTKLNLSILFGKPPQIVGLMLEITTHA